MINKKAQMGMWILIMTVLTLIVVIIGFTGVHIITTQDGQHTGYVTAIETNGIIFKTITVYFKTDVQSSQEDTYCLIDKSILPTLREKQENKEKVTITFYDYLLTSWTECGTGNGIISGVK